MMFRAPRIVLLTGHVAVLLLTIGVVLRGATPAGQTGAGNFYVAPDGRPDADGSPSRPWDLQTALNHPASVLPGATIWLRGGTYTGGFTSRLTGRADGYITVRAFRAERPILDSPADASAGATKPALTIEGPYVVVWGLEMTSSSPRRVADATVRSEFRPVGINVYGQHTKLINNIVHDTGDCIGHWEQAADAEIYGNLAYFCGWDGATRGYGHGLYIQNTGAPKEIRDNILFDQFGYGIHAYTEQGSLDDLRFRRNVVFESSVLSAVAPGWASDILVGGRKTALRPILEGNFTYGTGGSNSLGLRAGTEDGVVTGNYFIEGKGGVALGAISARRLSMTGNTFVGRVTGAYRQRDNIYESDPHGTWRFVLPNAYDPNRATVVVYNWDDAATVTLETGSFLAPGDRYELRNVQNYFADLVSGTYDGSAITLPMRGHTVGVPVGWHAPASTFPTFGVFVLTKAARTSKARRG